MDESRLPHYLNARLRCLAWLALLAAGLGELGRWHWLAELCSHFIPHCAAILLLAAVFHRRDWQNALFLLVGMGLAAWSLAPAPDVSSPSAAGPLRLLGYNLRVDNPAADADARWLATVDAKVIFVTEASHEWETRLQGLPPGCARYDDSPFGLALFSRVPLKSCRVLGLGGAAQGYPYIRAELADGRLIYGVHPPPPLGANLALARDESLRQLAARIRAEKAPVLVLGDFNSSPFSPRLRHFTEAAGLRRSSPNGRPTWLPGLLSLDHALISARAPVSGVGAYAWRGSDHRPIWIDW